MNKTKEDKVIKKEKEMKDTKKNLRIVLIVIIVLVILAITGVSIYFLVKNNKDIDELGNKQKENNEEESTSLMNYENMNNVELIDGEKK